MCVRPILDEPLNRYIARGKKGGKRFNGLVAKKHQTALALLEVYFPVALDLAFFGRPYRNGMLPVLHLFDVPFAKELFAFAHRPKSFSVRSRFPVPACR